jgi:fatty acid desaturase
MNFNDAEAYRGEIPHRLPIETLRSLSEINPWRSTFHIVLEWAGIAAAIWLCNTFWNPLLYVFTAIWIGARQHALAILMHDGTHHRLYPNRRLNDVVAEGALAWPLFFSLRSYRRNHFAHHRNPNTEEDPDWMRKMTADWVFPKRWPALAKILLKELMGFGAARMARDVRTISKRASAAEAKQGPRGVPVYVIARLGFYVAAAVVFTVFHLWAEFLLFWLVPVFTWLPVVLRIRSIAEHFAVEYDHPYTQMRTTYPSLLERLFIASKNVGYHIEHHLYPSVPFYNLPKLHALLLRAEGYRQRAHVTRTYLGVLRECLPGAKRTAGREAAA